MCNSEGCAGSGQAQVIPSTPGCEIPQAELGNLEMYFTVKTKINGKVFLLIGKITFRKQKSLLTIHCPQIHFIMSTHPTLGQGKPACKFLGQ